MENKNKILIKSKLKQEASKSIESLTTHGFPNLFRTNYYSIKFMWLIVILGSAALSVYFIAKTLSDYFDYNVTTEVRLIDTDELEFPVISICNKNKFSTNYSVNFVKKLVNSYSNFSFEEIFEPNFKHQNLTFLLRNRIENWAADYLFGNIDVNDREKCTSSPKDFLLYCRFDGNICSHSDFEYFYNQKYGNCYKFNENGLKKSVKINLESGLFLAFLLNHPKEIDMIGIEKGFFISIHSKSVDTSSDFESLIETSTGYQTNIEVRKSYFKKHPKPYSNCDFLNHSISSLNSEQIKNFKKLADLNISYSQSKCIAICRNQKLKESNLYFKNNELQIHYNITNYCSQICPLECEKITYESDKYITSFPRYYASYTQYLYNNGLNRLIDRNDMIAVKIYFSSFNFMNYIEVPSISLFGLISNLGGILGLFLGKFEYLKKFI